MIANTLNHGYYVKGVRYEGGLLGPSNGTARLARRSRACRSRSARMGKVDACLRRRFPQRKLLAGAEFLDSLAEGSWWCSCLQIPPENRKLVADLRQQDAEGRSHDPKRRHSYRSGL